jgi:hypothetical protein
MSVFDIVMKKPAEVSRSGECVWWLYQTHSPLRLTSVGFSMTMSNTPIASTDFSRFFHDYIKHTHRFDWLQQVFPWLYQTHPSLRLTSAGFSMTISNTPIVLTDFSRFFHDYIKHTHRLDLLQQVFLWLYLTHPSPRLTSAGFSMTISNTLIASTDFSRFFHDYIKHTHRYAGLLPEVSRSGECVWYSDGKTCWSQLKRCVLDLVMEKPAEVSRGDVYVWYSHGKTWWSQSRRWVCLI